MSVGGVGRLGLEGQSGLVGGMDQMPEHARLRQKTDTETLVWSCFLNCVKADVSARLALTQKDFRSYVQFVFLSRITPLPLMERFAFDALRLDFAQQV